MRGLVAFWFVVGALALPTAGMTVFAWRVVDSVRADARLTDARLREVAWTVLTYADVHGGFPTSESELRAFAARPEGVPTQIALAGAGELPADRSAASLDAAPLDLAACLDSIEIEWPIARDVQPILRSKGKATLQGTLPLVGQWLYAMAERLRAR